MYINSSFRPYEPHLHHLTLGECERSLGVRAYLVFVRKGDIASSLQVFSFHPSFSSEKTFPQVWKLKKLFTHFHFLSQLKAYILQTLKLFTHRAPMRQTNQLWIAFTNFHPKLMKGISSSIESYFFMILWIHVSNLSFLVEISFLHMKFAIWPPWQVCQF